MVTTPAASPVTMESARLDAPLGSVDGLGPKPVVEVDPPELDPYDDDGDSGAETALLGLGLGARPPTPTEGGLAGAAASMECPTTLTIIRWPASQCPGTPLTK